MANVYNIFSLPGKNIFNSRIIIVPTTMTGALKVLINIGCKSHAILQLVLTRLERI